jgi:thiosulfate/3-mercaptopyruvate sulfurtransferase
VREENNAQEEAAMDLDQSPLVSCAWLAAHLDDPRVCIVDVRWRSRYENGRGITSDDREGYRAGHIPGAVYAGIIADLSDAGSPVPDMMVPPAQFERVMSRLGIGADTLVVAYDSTGLPLGAARLWWGLSLYGHDKVRVLDGGLRDWQREGHATSTEIPVRPAAQFRARVRPEWLATKDDVVGALGDPGTVIVDCLTPELYSGGGERHLWGQRAGHVPGAVNIPSLANIDPALAAATAAQREQVQASSRSFRFAAPEVLAGLYRDAGVTPDRAVITYCGRGYAAACGLLALKLLGHRDARLYDGSWAEWSADPALPVETGVP